MIEEAEVDEKLAALAKASERVRPTLDFTDRVMSSVADAPSGWPLQVARAARSLVPIAAALAMLAVIWAVESEESTEAALAAQYGDVEEQW